MLTLGISTFRLYNHGLCLLYVHFHSEMFALLIHSVANIWRCLSLSAVIPMSFAYLRLLILLPPIDTPFSSFSIAQKNSSVKRWKRYGDSTHPCLVPHLILIPSKFSFSVRTTATVSNTVLQLSAFLFHPTQLIIIFLSVCHGLLDQTAFCSQ